MKNKQMHTPNMTAIQELHNRAKQSKGELSYDEYKNSYKNILWIDDRDDNDAGNDSLKWMLNFCDLDTCMQIEQVDLFREAVDKIVNNSMQYDLVIFDINLEKGFDEISESDEAEMEKCFGKYHIRFKYREINHMHAGYLLFRLLLAVGYPLARMLIFSGHATKDKAEQELKDIIFDERIYKEKKETLNIEKSFFDSDTQSYYRVRRLVYQACNYWIAKLNDSLKDYKDIPFNKLYYFYKNNYMHPKAVTARSFIEMLEHIQMLFPVSMPCTPDKLYYKVMQTVAAFHEESAKIQAINNHRDLKRYHSCVRNFRNWSSHNLMETKLSAQQFALLFCITLRTYFSWNSDNDLNNNALFDYEKIYGFNEIKNINDITAEKLGDNLLEIWEKVHSKLKNKYFSDLEEAIRELGKTGDCGDMSNYLFIPIWCPTDFLLPAKTQSGSFKKSGCVLIEVNKNSISRLCKKVKSTNDNSADICFKRNSFQWVVRD